MNRRTFLAALPAFAMARSILAAAGASTSQLGICTFSCHRHWKAVANRYEGVKFTDALGFARYTRELGAGGVQTSLRCQDEATARQMRDFTEQGDGYYEGELRLPRTESELASFEIDVRLARAAGARVARAVFTNGRRYEVFRTLADFRAFAVQAEKTLALIAPVLQKHQLTVAIENHKDLTSDELAALMRRSSSEWIGVLVDTGNNIALLEEPHAVVETLAPFAKSVHLKDMAVQSAADGFLLSEVPLGTGALDLPRIIATLRKANPAVVFNLEMATRDPLHVPCLTDAYFATFPERKATHLESALAFVAAHPPKQPTPKMTGLSVAEQLAHEENNNRHGLSWMQNHFRA